MKSIIIKIINIRRIINLARMATITLTVTTTVLKIIIINKKIIKIIIMAILRVIKSSKIISSMIEMNNTYISNTNKIC